MATRILYENRQMDAQNLNIRMDSKTSRHLEWLSRVTHWPRSMIVRLIIRKTRPEDLGVDIYSDTIDDTPGVQR